jgi:protein-disulfide isomerase
VKILDNLFWRKLMARRPEVRVKRKDIKEVRRRQQQRSRMITLGVIGAVAVLIVVVVIASMQGNQVSGDFIIPEEHTRPMADRNSMGDPNAPVQIEEFSDYLCSHCKSFAQTQEPGIVTDFIATNDVHFTYIPFSFMAPESGRAAEASYCAADQGKFWEYHDIIFENVGTTTPQPLADARLIQYAEALDLNVDDFSSCLTGNTYRTQVQDDLNYGRQVGVTGTPTFNINGRLVGRGEIVQVIQEELARLNGE